MDNGNLSALLIIILTRHLSNHALIRLYSHYHRISLVIGIVYRLIAAVIDNSAHPVGAWIHVKWAARTSGNYFILVSFRVEFLNGIGCHKASRQICRIIVFSVISHMINDDCALPNRRSVFLLRHIANKRQRYIRAGSCSAYPCFLYRNFYSRFTIPDIKLGIFPFLDAPNRIRIKEMCFIVAVLIDRHNLINVIAVYHQCALVIGFVLQQLMVKLIAVRNSDSSFFNIKVSSNRKLWNYDGILRRNTVDSTASAGNRAHSSMRLENRSIVITCKGIVFPCGLIVFLSRRDLN